MPLPAMPTSYAVAFLLLDARKYTESGAGTKFNKGTSKLGSILSDSLVGCLKDKSEGAISTFGYTLPVWAAGLSSPAQAKSPNLFCAESHTMNSWKSIALNNKLS
ncbi:hypothetical protein BDL97_10G067100 [Sphagnum fallax]|nr:hypothetical protein BDL97_10G067100 [Sphagnum fallax]KAH8950114.1 hypothetical protein BDL97_10G067100 [Sphagnum fallax]